MPGPAWADDPDADSPVIATNVSALLGQLAATAAARQEPRIALAHDWHRRIFAGLTSIPSAAYLGQARGTDHPDLVDYEVVLRERRAGRVLSQGVPAEQVGSALTQLERALRATVARVDASIPIGTRPRSADHLLAVIELAASIHGEWIRIHPYANGNGRVARTWANWVALRYGLPPFVRIKPRPDGLVYGHVAHLSMGRPPDFRGDHLPTVSVFLDLLRSYPAAP